MHTQRLLVPALALLAALLLPAALADEGTTIVRDRIQLDNGRTYDGVIVHEDECSVILEMTSESGGKGRMTFPRARIARIERNIGTAGARPAAGAVRDAWYLLHSSGHLVGARHLLLKHVRSGGDAGWRLEETIEHFPRGPRVPAATYVRTERVDLAFHPLALHFREVGEASIDPDGPRRYERILSGSVRSGMWDALVHEGETSGRRLVALPEDGRARLGAREHLLRERRVGLVSVELLDPAVPGLVRVRAGYTALDAVDDAGRRYDEFVWEEDGVRRVSRFQDAEVIEETIADGVVATPATPAQVDAARAEAARNRDEGEPGLVRLAELGIALRLPDRSWSVDRVETSTLATGWRKVAQATSPLHVADVRIEWDPEGAAMAPTPEEAATRLLQRLKTACPDLRVVDARRALALDPPGQPAWRMEVTGTLKGERIRTIAVVVDQGQGRALLLVACPEVSWSQASRSIEMLVDSIRRL